jgi:hypothetical protein
MNVYLVPIASARYALYSEVASVADADEATAASSFWGRLKASFRRAVDEGEAEANRTGGEPDPSKGRLRRLITRKLAEAVAEQRLLWHLRHETSATLVYPDRLDSASALEAARAEFASDYGRHRRWLIIDGTITAVTGPLFFFVPGPNIVSWYFSFRAVGHFFSMRGAARALVPGFFVPEPSVPLTAIADALGQPADERARRLGEAERSLGLDRLAAFVTRVALGRRL